MSKLLITGTGYSGTHYMAEVLRRCGLCIEHESDEVPNTVSWRHLHRYTEYETVLHQVRNLRKVVTGMAYREPDWAWRIRDRVCSAMNDAGLSQPYQDNALKNAAKATLVYYRVAEEVTERSYRVEDVDAKRITDICHLVDVAPEGIEDALDAVSTNKSSKKAYHDGDYYEWEELREVPHGEALCQVAEEWDYKE